MAIKRRTKRRAVKDAAKGATAPTEAPAVLLPGHPATFRNGWRTSADDPFTGPADPHPDFGPEYQRRGHRNPGRSAEMRASRAERRAARIEANLGEFVEPPKRTRAERMRDTSALTRPHGA